MPWGVPRGEVNGEDLPQTKDVDNRVRHGYPHASSKAQLTSSSAKCTEVKNIVSDTSAVMVASYLSPSYLISASILSNLGAHLISYLIYGCGLVSS